MNILKQVETKFNGIAYSNYIMIICPIHGGDNYNMVVHEDWAHCYSCGKNLSTKSLLASGNSYLPVRTTQKKSRFRNPFTKWMRNETLAKALEIAWKSNNCRPSHYLSQRGINPDHQKKLGLGNRDNWYTVPIRDQEGEIIGATARASETNNSPAKYVNVSGQNPHMLYVPRWDLYSDTLHLTYGIFDAVSLSLMGYFSASTTTGQSLNPEALSWYRGKIIILPDRREEDSAYNLKYLLGTRGQVIIVKWNVNEKDISNIFVNRPEEINRILA